MTRRQMTTATSNSMNLKRANERCQPKEAYKEAAKLPIAMLNDYIIESIADTPLVWCSFFHFYFPSSPFILSFYTPTNANTYMLIFKQRVFFIHFFSDFLFSFFARRVCFVRMHWNRTVEAPILDKGIYPGTQSANAEKSSNKKSNRLYLKWSDEWPGIKQIVNVLCIPTGFALVNYTVCNVCVSARKIIDRMYAWMLSTRN